MERLTAGTCCQHPPPDRPDTAATSAAFVRRRRRQLRHLPRSPRPATVLPSHLRPATQQFRRHRPLLRHRLRRHLPEVSSKFPVPLQRAISPWSGLRRRGRSRREVGGVREFDTCVPELPERRSALRMSAVTRKPRNLAGRCFRPGSGDDGGRRAAAAGGGGGGGGGGGEGVAGRRGRGRRRRYPCLSSDVDRRMASRAGRLEQRTESGLRNRISRNRGGDALGTKVEGKPWVVISDANRYPKIWYTKKIPKPNRYLFFLSQIYWYFVGIKSVS